MLLFFPSVVSSASKKNTNEKISMRNRWEWRVGVLETVLRPCEIVELLSCWAISLKLHVHRTADAWSRSHMRCSCLCFLRHLAQLIRSDMRWSHHKLLPRFDPKNHGHGFRARLGPSFLGLDLLVLTARAWLRGLGPAQTETFFPRVVPLAFGSHASWPLFHIQKRGGHV